MYRIWGYAPTTKVFRIEAKTWQGERHGAGLRIRETPSHVSAAGRALGLLLSRALSSCLPTSIIGWRGALASSVVFIQKVVDSDVLLDQTQTAPQGVSGLLWRESFQTAMADAVVLAKVAIDRLDAVVGLSSDDVGFLAFGVSLPANNLLIS